MRWARGFVLLLAVGAAISAALLVRNSIPPKQVETRKPGRPPIELLVARRPVAAGEMITAADLRWQPWPAQSFPTGAIHRRFGASSKPFEPALARYPLLEGEPLANAKLVRAGDGSTIAALIAQGMRAVAVAVREDNAAGGLIQPGDRVDVLWTRRSGDRMDARPATRTILRGVRILAIGKSLNARSKNTGSRTATLELTPKQARMVASARAGGDLLLALIPAIEPRSSGEDQAADALDTEPADGIQITKFGRQSAASFGLGVR